MVELNYMNQLDKAYNPQQYEDEIYRYWENKKLFDPDVIGKRKKQHFSIVLPPPNVTGTLHLGHASMLAIEDLMVRYKRMSGLDTVWIPGTDHAAIATQNVVEKKLYQTENKTRHDYGRQAFLEKVEEHVEQSKSTIHHQLRKVGASLDWDREAYTLDETRSRAVKKVFKEMYDDGLIYRGYRIVNWCPRCQSTLADDEVNYKETKSKLYWLKYGPFVLATTRPETKLGDTAVAVHPRDERYHDMVGEKYMIPGVLGEFEITVVADEAVDPTFGSGAIKVTPGHSQVDYEIARRHNVPIKKIIDEQGKMMNNCGKYAGMTTLEAREAIVADMEKMGLIDHIDEDYENKLSVCYRCKSIVEPLPSDQWFVDVNKKVTKKGNKYFKKGASLKEVALKVVREKEINIIPEHFEKIYFHWMENLRDWCISRQIWFGHQIPVWYKKSLEFKVVASRHGEAQSNKNGFLNSSIVNRDNELTALGKEQIINAAENFKIKNQKFDLIISSDLIRTKQTADIFSTVMGAPIIFDERLREVGVGDFEGGSGKEFDKLREGNFGAWQNNSPHGIESFTNLKKRVYSFVEDIKEKYFDKKILLVTHGDIFRLLQGYNQNLTDEEIFNLTYPQVGENITIDLTTPPEVFVGESAPAGANWEQDPDTLDTWFSSGLWTFTSMLPKDWDGKSFVCQDIKRFHPTTVLETGYDILFFWVARMILMTTYVMGEVPFENVYLHGLIRDKDGEKMSKSKPETAIDPVEAGTKYGFDAVRLSLLVGNSAGNDIRLYDEKIEGYRNFVNKFWNICRFILTNLAEFKVEKNVKPQTLADRWLLSLFNRKKQEVTKLLDDYNFSSAAEILREFTWNDLADWYLEIAKIEKNKDQILSSVLFDLLKLWHPYIPFVTQVIWNQLNLSEELMLSSWPVIEKKLLSEKAEKQMNAWQDLVVKVRNLRAEYKIDPAKKVRFAIKDSAPDYIFENTEILKSLARLEEVIFVKEKPEKTAVVVSTIVEGYLYLQDLMNFDQEKDRLAKEIEKMQKYQFSLENKLNNQEFVNQAPPAVVEGEKEKLVQTKEKVGKLKAQLAEIN